MRGAVNWIDAGRDMEWVEVRWGDELWRGEVKLGTRWIELGLAGVSWAARSGEEGKGGIEHPRI